jgi:hypothetical protein
MGTAPADAGASVGSFSTDYTNQDKDLAGND